METANHLRSWLSAMAYVLVDTLRRVGLALHSVHRRLGADHSPQASKLGAQGAPAHQRATHSRRYGLGCPARFQLHPTAIMPKIRLPMLRTMTRVLAHTRHENNSTVRLARPPNVSTPTVPLTLSGENCAAYNWESGPHMKPVFTRSFRKWWVGQAAIINKAGTIAVRQPSVLLIDFSGFDDFVADCFALLTPQGVFNQ